MSKVILYTTYCPKCSVLEKKMKAKNIEFDICDDMDIMEQKGFMSAPMLEVDGEVMDFMQANEWISGQE